MLGKHVEQVGLHSGDLGHAIYEVPSHFCMQAIRQATTP
jgi:hypothetical protein